MAQTAAADPNQDVRRIAAIDIGSNSVRQVVADVKATGAISVVDEMKATPRLASGLADTGLLAESSMTRATEAIGRMAMLARQLGVERIEAVATSAVREATNGADFLARIELQTGVRVRVLGGDEEAALAFRSARAHFELDTGRAVVADIGGGSLELVFSADGLVEHVVSLPLGALRLTDRYLRRRPTSRKALQAMRRDIRDVLRHEMPARDWRGAPVVGSGGTFTSLARVQLSGEGMLMARNVHAARVPRDEVERLLEMLHAMEVAERRRVKGLNPDRADIIVAGLAVIAEVLARLKAREVQVSRYGIREGLLLETARVRPTVAEAAKARGRAVREIAERCHYDAPHALAVQRLALQLFDAIGARLGCAPEERQLLADAALLHDIGHHISHDRHHKHTYHLVLHAELSGVPPQEQVVIANVARYHRGAVPRKKHRNYGTLERSLRGQVKRLAAILRVADGFDRGHRGAVQGLKVRWLERVIRIAPIARNDQASVRLECWDAHRKSELLADVAGAPVEILTPDGAVLSSARIEDENGGE